MGPCERFYGSVWQHPVLLWAAAFAGLAVVLGRTAIAPSLRRYALVLVGLSLLDAWLTANQVLGLGALPAGLGFPVAFTFVLLGDLRFWLFLEAARDDGTVAIDARAVARALGWSMVVPLLTIVPSKLAGPGAVGLRWIFLAYEVSFLVLLAVRLRWRPPAAQEWGQKVARFALLYYGLWAGADALILATGIDAGHALRVLPNLLYYGGLPAVMVYCGSKRQRVPSP